MKQQNKKKAYTFEELLNEQGYFIYTNVGTSMMPLLRQQKDLIEIRKKDRKIKKYDVALYKRNGKYVLHRCIKVTSDGYIFAGDHNIVKEYDVNDDMIIGLMHKVIRDGKEVTLSSFTYRLYSFLWVNFFPVKVALLKFRRMFQRAFGITPLKLRNYLNWKLVMSIDLFIDYRITGHNLSNYNKISANNHFAYPHVNYLTLFKIFSRVNISSQDKIMVVGCGNGRVIASLLQKNCPCQIYGIEENEVFLQLCAEWTKTYSNVNVTCGDVFCVDYNSFSILYLNRSFPGQESIKFIRLIEQQMQHSITVIYPFDQSSSSIFENRPYWILQQREELFKIHGLKVVGTPKRFSVWTYTPTLLT